METAGWGVKVILEVRPLQPVEVATKASAPSKLSGVEPVSSYKATPEVASAAIAAKVVVAKVSGVVVAKDTVTAPRYLPAVEAVKGIFTTAVGLEPALMGASGKLPLIKPTTLGLISAALAGAGVNREKPRLQKIMEAMVKKTVDFLRINLQAFIFSFVIARER